MALDSAAYTKLVRRIPKMKHRFRNAMLTYAVLALLAGFTLDGGLRIATLIFLAGIALKTYIAVLKDRLD